MWFHKSKPIEIRHEQSTWFSFYSRNYVKYLSKHYASWKKKKNLFNRSSEKGYFIICLYRRKWLGELERLTCGWVDELNVSRIWASVSHKIFNLFMYFSHPHMAIHIRINLHITQALKGVKLFLSGSEILAHYFQYVLFKIDISNNSKSSHLKITVLLILYALFCLMGISRIS